MENNKEQDRREQWLLNNAFVVKITCIVDAVNLYYSFDVIPYTTYINNQ